MRRRRILRLGDPGLQHHHQHGPADPERAPVSFAQFEREVTGERIRDKIAASKAKGMWMGGLPPLGYDPPTDLDHARARRQRARGGDGTPDLQDVTSSWARSTRWQHWLDKQGIRSKARTTAKGRELGGLPFSRGALFHLLRNRLYLGVIVHKDTTFPGAHPAIVDARCSTRCRPSSMQERAAMPDATARWRPRR